MVKEKRLHLIKKLKQNSKLKRRKRNRELRIRVKIKIKSETLNDSGLMSNYFFFLHF
jgi:hypothetical protein